jgi:hypothetical protein
LSQATITVIIDSIPSGSDVYEISEDGELGKRLGTTPYEHKIGIAAQYVNNTETLRPMYCNNVYAWGKGTHWARDAQNRNFCLKLRVALWKEGNAFGISEKTIFKRYLDRRAGKYGRYHPAEDIKPQDISWTIPLKTIEQLKAELATRAVQHTGNQNIVIQNQKDDLDKTNGLFDLLFKMKAARDLQW